MNRDRDYEERTNRDRYDRDDRDFGDRAGDEVRSWFGDDDAERRRRMDQMGQDRTGSGRMDHDRPGRQGRTWNERGDEDQIGYGRRGGRFGERFGAFGGRHGSEVGSRYGGNRGRNWWGGQAGRRYVDDAGPAYGMSDYYGRHDRWGASDWSEQAARDQGRHVGRGPAGYQRSADRIMEDANEALTWAGEVDASQIQVTVDGAEVTLEGTVDSRRAKRAAEDAVEEVRGVRDVHNRLRVEEARAHESDKQTSQDR